MKYKFSNWTHYAEYAIAVVHSSSGKTLKDRGLTLECLIL
jgi:hypothetical protein